MHLTRPRVVHRKDYRPPSFFIDSVDLGTDVSKCQVSATIAGTGATPGVITVTPGAATNLLTVSTFDTAEPPVAANRPFDLLVAC